MTIDGRLPIAKYAAELPGAMAVFESLGLDYACAGDRSLDDAAHAEGIAPDIVIAALRRLKGDERKPSWNDRSLSELTRYLVEQHHRFVREELARIAVRLADVCTAPGGVPSYLVSLRAAFTKLSAIVLPHLHHEEEDAFRVIEAVEKAWNSSEPHRVPTASLDASLHSLADEHGAIAAELRTMRELRMRLADSDSLSLQCSSIQEDLATLEAHLHEYMFLENCILFPRASALAEQVAPSVMNVTGRRDGRCRPIGYASACCRWLNVIRWGKVDPAAPHFIHYDRARAVRPQTHPAIAAVTPCPVLLPSPFPSRHHPVLTRSGDCRHHLHADPATDCWRR